MNRLLRSFIVCVLHHASTHYFPLSLSLPFGSRFSSLPPWARANHVLFSRSPLSGMRPCGYRAQLVLRVLHESSKYRSRPLFSTYLFFPYNQTQHCALTPARHPASRSWRAVATVLVAPVTHHAVRSLCCACFTQNTHNSLLLAKILSYFI